MGTQLASAEASLNRKPMTTFRCNAPRDLENALEDDASPGEKVIEFQHLKQQARNIVLNRKEDTKVNRVLAQNKAFRAPVQPEPGQKGLIATRNLPGEARFQGRVRNLLDNKVQFGRAIDRATRESFPAKLVAAVPQGSEQIADETIKQGGDPNMGSGSKSHYLHALPTCSR